MIKGMTVVNSWIDNSPLSVKPLIATNRWITGTSSAVVRDRLSLSYRCLSRVRASAAASVTLKSGSVGTAIL